MLRNIFKGCCCFLMVLLNLSVIGLFVSLAKLHLVGL